MEFFVGISPRSRWPALLGGRRFARLALVQAYRLLVVLGDRAEAQTVIPRWDEAGIRSSLRALDLEFPFVAHSVV